MTLKRVFNCVSNRRVGFNSEKVKDQDGIAGIQFEWDRTSEASVVFPANCGPNSVWIKLQWQKKGTKFKINKRERERKRTTTTKTRTKWDWNYSTCGSNGPFARQGKTYRICVSLSPPLMFSLADSATDWRNNSGWTQVHYPADRVDPANLADGRFLGWDFRRKCGTPLPPFFRLKTQQVFYFFKKDGATNSSQFKVTWTRRNCKLILRVRFKGMSSIYLRSSEFRVSTNLKRKKTK